TWDNQRDLARAVALPAAEENPADLRSEALACLAGGDLRLKHTLAEGFTAYQAAFSPDGQTLALVQGIGDSPAPMSVRLFDPMTGREWPALSFSSNPPGQERIGRAECVYALRFSPDGRWLAAGTRTGMLHAWDLKAALPRTHSWAGHPGPVKQIAFSGDSTSLYSLGIDGIIKGWDARQGWAALPLAKATDIAAVVPLPPAQVIACWRDGRLGVVGPEGVDGTSFGGPDNVNLVAASPDSRTLAVHHNGELHLHDFAQRSRPIGKLRDSGEDAV